MEFLRRYWPLLSILSLVIGFTLLAPSQALYDPANPYAQNENTEQLSWGGVAETAAAVFTGLLALFAFVQVMDSRKSSERQLRAYLSVEPRKVANFYESGTVRVDLLVHNHGQTPAQNVRQNYCVEIFEYPLSSGFVFPPTANAVADDYSVFPRADTEMRLHANRELTIEDIQRIQSGKASLHCWGVVRYVDAFGRERTTNFSCYAGGEVFSRVLADFHAGKPSDETFSWTYGAGHNRAT